MASLGRLFFLLIAIPVCGFLYGEEAGLLTVIRVVDGDTLILSNNERVRLIGVDTPEYHASAKLRRDADHSKTDAKTIQKQGLKASTFTKGLMNGQRVKLEYDEGNNATNHRDKYGRLLAYVYLVEGQEEDLVEAISPDVRDLPTFHEGFLNALLIEAGYGHTYTRYPFKYKDQFLFYEQEAHQSGRGLWGQ